MKTKLCIFLCVVIGFCMAPESKAQAITQKVVAAAGGHVSNSSFGDFHWTVGEPVVENFRKSVVLSQGFHQTYLQLPVSVNQGFYPDLKLSIYPNPSYEQTILEIQPWKEGMVLDIRDLSGKHLMQLPLTQDRTVLSLRQLQPGCYLFVIRKDSDVYGVARFLKTGK